MRARAQYGAVNSDRSEELVERPRVMAAVWGPGSPATALAMLDEAGQLVAFMFAGAMSGSLRAPHPNDPPLFHEANRKARALTRARLLRASPARNATLAATELTSP